jgi:hypothetical protein
LKPQPCEIQAKWNKMTGIVHYGFVGSTVMALSSLSLDITCSPTSDTNEVFAADRFAGWWDQVQAMSSYQAIVPNLAEI